MRYSLVLGAGGIIGAVVCLVLGMTSAAAIVGAFVSATCAFVLYDVGEVRALAPRIARSAFARSRQIVREIRPMTFALTRWLTVPRVLIWFLIVISMTLAYWTRSAMQLTVPTILFVLIVVVWASTIFAAEVLLFEIAAGLWGMVGWLPAVGKCPEGKTGDPTDGMDMIFFGIGSQRVPWFQLALDQTSALLFIVFVIPFIIVSAILKILLWWLPIGLWLACRFGFRLIGLSLSLCLAILLGSLRFAWHLFVEVHKEEQRMAAVDSAIGVLTSYVTLRVIYGGAFLEMPPVAKLSFIALAAALAVAVGLVNCHLVAKKVLRLQPT
ncbi:hypothetical protein HY631_04260 [Candidatus Uhrbacteria bacterium]|nr:hypothetical protein [Candidatus Uhrbacteria bacterium]